MRPSKPRTRIFQFIHPVLPIAAVLFGIIVCLTWNDTGGPCNFNPLILVGFLFELGIVLGLILSLIRTISYFGRKHGIKTTSK